MKAIEALDRPMFYNEACYLADKHEIPWHQQQDFIARTSMALAHQAWRRDIQPWLDMKVKIMLCFLSPAEYTQAERDAFATFDELIQQRAKFYGLVPPERAGETWTIVAV